MTWADVGAVLVGFLAFTGVGASACWLAARAHARRREHGAVDWLDVLDAFEGTPPLLARASMMPSRPTRF